MKESGGLSPPETLLPDGSHHLLRPLLSLVSQTDGATREEFLRLAWQFGQSDACVAFLWLYDPSRSCLILDRFHSPKANNGIHNDLLRGQQARPKTSDQLLSASPESLGVSLQVQEGIAEWCAREFEMEMREYAFPMFKKVSQSGKSELVAVLNLITNNKLSQPLSDLLQYLADGLAALINRDRGERCFSALKDVAARVGLDKRVDDVLALAAGVLQKRVRAELCLVYRQQRDLGLKAVAGSPKPAALDRLLVRRDGSVVRRILLQKRPIRVCDFQDARIRQDALGTIEFDPESLARENELLTGPLISLMGAPVLITEHGVAVIMLYNKQHENKNSHLTSEFSKTDEEVLQAMCEFLAAVLPSIEVTHLTKQLSETIFTGALKDERTQQAVYDLFADIIPGTTCVLIHSNDPSSAMQPIYLGGSAWFQGKALSTKLTDEVAPIDASADALPGLEQGEVGFYLTVKIPYMDLQHMTIGLRRGYLSSYEKNLVWYFARELSQALRGDREVDREVHDLLQIRHILRNELNGLISEVNTAFDKYRVCKRESFAADVVAQLCLDKNLARAKSYGAATRILLEESRFLIAEINRASLRVGSHSLNSLVCGVLDTLGPSADERRLTFKYQNKIQNQDDQVPIDLNAMRILVFNIVDNAVKYSHKNNQIILRTFIDRDHWKLRVTNWGVYIRPADREVIFEPFVRRPTGSDALARPGTGLGLAVARRIAQAHGGSIEVESEVLRPAPELLARTQFFVTIPRQMKRIDKS